SRPLTTVSPLLQQHQQQRRLHRRRNRRTLTWPMMPSTSSASLPYRPKCARSASPNHRSQTPAGSSRRVLTIDTAPPALGGAATGCGHVGCVERFSTEDTPVCQGGSDGCHELIWKPRGRAPTTASSALSTFSAISSKISRTSA